MERRVFYFCPLASGIGLFERLETDRGDLVISDFRKDFRRDREDSVRVNHQIRVPKIRVVLDDGEMLGVLSPQEALREAEKRGLDLVEISPKAQPPVCKITDYGKFKYELKKKNQGQKKQSSAVLKEITLSPSTDIHDLNFKMKNAQGFLDEGHRVKISIRFRGREMAHPEIGQAQMNKVIESLKEHGAPESIPRMEGRLLIGMFTPVAQLSKAQRTALVSAAETAGLQAIQRQVAKAEARAAAGGTAQKPRINR